MRKTVVLLSGGMDSATLLWHFLSKGDHVKALAVDYGQRHRKELDFAARLAKAADVEFRIADLSAIRGLLAGSSQTSDEIDVPEGHYADPSMKKTLVPNRNMLMLSVAIAWATSLGFDKVGYAAHAGDHPIYPDCRPEFADALGLAAHFSGYEPIKLARPFVSLTKTEVASMGAALKVPYGLTWSCYKGGEKHCGKCGTCVERREAFQEAELTDPTEYE
jgi:7-cyano-7-deazaguanine synthase